MPNGRVDPQRRKWFEREPTWRRNPAPSRVLHTTLGAQPVRKPIKPKP